MLAAAALRMEDDEGDADVVHGGVVVKMMDGDEGRGFDVRNVHDSNSRFLGGWRRISRGRWWPCKMVVDAPAVVVDGAAVADDAWPAGSGTAARVSVGGR
ncbi:hypothetical protein LR48_Vigan07g132100 [Vigna angularis]|uniref:Uncharacterized protein n=1 Tax=Phaseolus angularis TaxID=3914 RepID=A0A0L9UYG1_PHAAN|nr:hypothetical protein LR48_Vigan07g132100 [Vigna angularis]